MKKITILLIAIITLTAFLGCDALRSPAQIAQAKSKAISAVAQTAVTIPNVQYFQERQTIAKWTERWNKPNIPTYVYLISYGTIIGYYVADGKPASTQSYLIPEKAVHVYAGNPYILDAPDIDGTYGANNPGIRFFTAEGTAVEWGGSGASYIYSDAPLPLKVPKLNIVVTEKK